MRRFRGKIGQLVDEIATASEEQAHGIAQVNTAVAEMDKVTQSDGGQCGGVGGGIGGAERPGGADEGLCGRSGGGRRQ